MRYCLIPISMATFKKQNNNNNKPRNYQVLMRMWRNWNNNKPRNDQVLMRMWRNWNPVHSSGEWMMQPLWCFLKKLKVELPYDMTIPVLHVCPQSNETRISKRLFVHLCSWGGAWQATVHGVAKSQTQLSDEHTCSQQYYSQ